MNSIFQFLFGVDRTNINGDIAVTKFGGKWLSVTLTFDLADWKCRFRKLLGHVNVSWNLVMISQWLRKLLNKTCWHFPVLRFRLKMTKSDYHKHVTLWLLVAWVFELHLRKSIGFWPQLGPTFWPNLKMIRQLFYELSRWSQTNKQTNKQTHGHTWQKRSFVK